MLKQEARWLGEQLASLDQEGLFPLANLGSSTGEFRRAAQPWIDREIFAPARAAARRVVHCDLKAGEGVDLAGDLGDPKVVEQLRQLGLRGVLCSNMLEHVTDLPAMCRTIWALVPPGGVLVCTVPYRYPIHHDPIDNGFRPTPAELAACFPGGELLRGAIVEDHSHLHYLRAAPMRLLGLIWKTLTPFLGLSRWRAAVGYWAYMRRRFAATCVAIRKTSQVG